DEPRRGVEFLAPRAKFSATPISSGREGRVAKVSALRVLIASIVVLAIAGGPGAQAAPHGNASARMLQRLSLTRPSLASRLTRWHLHRYLAPSRIGSTDVY